MRIPESLRALVEYGLVQEVVRPLMSGKEAQVYLVISDGEERVAKIYKDAENRSFKHRAEYTEGRGVRNTRDQRAIGKRSTHGRAQDEAAWRATEVNMISRLQVAGVRVPVAYNFIDGVLIMELVKDAEGNPAPRLGDRSFSEEHARAIYDVLIHAVSRMLCAGVVHGDLSDFNVLLAADGPVLIDFPQAVDSAHNPNARKLLLRDVDNLHDFLGRFVKNPQRLPYGEEMWDLYERNLLTPDTPLTGRYRAAQRKADTAAVLSLIEDAHRDEQRRRGLAPPRPPRQGPAGGGPPRQGPPGGASGSPRQGQPGGGPPRQGPPSAPQNQQRHAQPGNPSAPQRQGQPSAPQNQQRHGQPGNPPAPQRHAQPGNLQNQPRHGQPGTPPAPQRHSQPASSQSPPRLAPAGAPPRPPRH